MTAATATGSSVLVAIGASYCWDCTSKSDERGVHRGIAQLTPAGKHGGEMDDEVTDLRWIVLHMIEETARHAGHLDAARELLDGHVGLGPR